MRVPVFIDVLIPRADEPAWPRQLGLFGRLIAAIRRDLAAQHAARELEALDDRMLADIGLTRADIPRIARRTREQWQ